MFIQTESTPNPATLKFLPGRDVMGEGAVADFPSAESAGRSPLAKALFAIPGSLPGVFRRGFHFRHQARWRLEASEARHPGRDHGAFHPRPAVDGRRRRSEADESYYERRRAEVVEQIKELIETRVRPAVAQDGGDIIFKGFDGDTGIVSLHLQGSCAGCPSSTMTLKNGIENMLRHYVPEVTAVEAV